VNEVGVRAGESVEPGRSLVELDDPGLRLRLAEVDSRLETSRLRRSQHLVTDLSKVREEDARASALEHERALRESELANTSVRSPARGTVVECMQPADIGRYVARGEALATVAGSTLVVRASLTEHELADAGPLAGQRVEFRSRCDPGRTWAGRIERIAHDSGELEHARRRFEVEVTLDESADLDSRIHGATGELLLSGRYEPVGLRTWRSVLALAGRPLP
jgi:multidrug resistance efflux pump